MSASYSFRVLFMLAIMIGSAIICFVGFLRPGMPHVRGEMHSMIEGTCMQPFVRRALVPFTVRGIEALISYSPGSANKMPDTTATELTRFYFGTPHTAFRKSIVMLLSWFSLVGFVFAFRALLKSLYRMPEATASYISLLALLFIPVYFFRAVMLYDVPGLFLTTMCIYALFEKRWTLFYPVYLLATINKESSIILVSLTILLLRNQPWRTALPHVLSQIVLWSAIFVLLLLHFNQNPGETFEWTFTQNLSFWRLHLGVIGYTQLAIYGTLMFFALRNWSVAPRPLRIIALGLSPLFLAGLLFGSVEELRIYYEFHPVLILLITPSVVDSISGGSTDTTPSLAKG